MLSGNQPVQAPANHIWKVSCNHFRMRKRTLGNTGIEVSEIAFGGVEIGMPYGIGISGKKDMLLAKDVIRLLHTALEKGINFFDTARAYGNSEYLIGKAFKDRRNKKKEYDENRDDGHEPK